MANERRSWEAKLGIAAAVAGIIAVPLALLAYLFPLSPDRPTQRETPNGVPTVTPRVGLPRGPGAGLEFWQDGKLAYMSAVPGGDNEPERRLDVELKAAPFEVRFPYPKSDTTFQLCGGYDQGSFSIPPGTDTDQDSEHSGCFYAPKTSSNSPFGDGRLLLYQGFNHNYGAFNQIIVKDHIGSITFTSIYMDNPELDGPFSLVKQPLYLTFFNDVDNDHQMGFGEVEHVILHFS